MTAAEEIARLREELAKAHAVIATLQAELDELRKQLAERDNSVPFVKPKPNAPKRDKADKQPLPRRKRAKD